MIRAASEIVTTGTVNNPSTSVRSNDVFRAERNRS